jgi:hypothetical protein
MWTTIIASIIVILIIVLGISLFARSLSKNRWLKQHGTHIIARVTDSIFAAGSGTTKVIIAEWTDPRTTTTYQFRTYVPQSAHVKLGESVDVLIDATNPERYMVTSVASISMKKR